MLDSKQLMCGSEYFATIPCCSRLTLAKYATTGLVPAPLKEIQKMKDSLSVAHFVVEERCFSACRTCTIIRNNVKRQISLQQRCFKRCTLYILVRCFCRKGSYFAIIPSCSPSILLKKVLFEVTERSGVEVYVERD